MLGYEHRDQNLLEIGFSSYKEYLKSDLWKAIRKKAIDQTGGTCRFCDKPATVVHHMSYRVEVLHGERLWSLIPLCNGHHFFIEFHSDGRKKTCGESRKCFGIMMKQLHRQRNPVRNPDKSRKHPS